MPAAGGPCILGVGLDVERADRAPRNPLALARRRLAAREAAMVAGGSRGRRQGGNSGSEGDACAGSDKHCTPTDRHVNLDLDSRT